MFLEPRWRHTHISYFFDPTISPHCKIIELCWIKPKRRKFSPPLFLGQNILYLNWYSKNNRACPPWLFYLSLWWSDTDISMMGRMKIAGQYYLSEPIFCCFWLFTAPDRAFFRGHLFTSLPSIFSTFYNLLVSWIISLWPRLPSSQILHRFSHFFSLPPHIPTSPVLRPHQPTTPPHL